MTPRAPKLAISTKEKQDKAKAKKIALDHADDVFGPMWPQSEKFAAKVSIVTDNRIHLIIGFSNGDFRWCQLEQDSDLMSGGCDVEISRYGLDADTVKTQADMDVLVLQVASHLIPDIVIWDHSLA